MWSLYDHVDEVGPRVLRMVDLKLAFARFVHEQLLRVVLYHLFAIEQILQAIKHERLLLMSHVGRHFILAEPADIIVAAEYLFILCKY